jgi:hypothetical protein
MLMVFIVIMWLSLLVVTPWFALGLLLLAAISYGIEALRLRNQRALLSEIEKFRMENRQIVAELAEEEQSIQRTDIFEGIIP